MSIWTQLFLSNTILLIFVAFIDRNLLNDKIEYYVPSILYTWTGLWLFSIPVWLIYLVIS